jgi:hypothetical protein
MPRRGSYQGQSLGALPSDLSHAKVPNTRSTQSKGLIDVADDNDLRCTFRERDGCRREGAKDINDHDRSDRALCAG